MYQYWEGHRSIFETFLLPSEPPQRTGPRAAFYQTPGRIRPLVRNSRSFEFHFQWLLVAGDWGGEWVSETGGVSKIEALLVPLQSNCPTSSLSPLAERER